MSEALFESWAIVEVLGHRTRPGFVREVEIAGSKMLRVDIPTPDGDVTEFYSSASIYSLRPCSEEIARDAANERYGSLRKPVRPITYREPARDTDTEEARVLSAKIDMQLAGADEQLEDSPPF